MRNPNPESQIPDEIRIPKAAPSRLFGWRILDAVRTADFGFQLVLLVLTAISTSAAPSLSSGTNYFLTITNGLTNHLKAIHVVQLNRCADWQFHPVLATLANHTGLATLRELVENSTNWGVPLAAINGDFFQRHGFVPGDPRGLMLDNGELVSAPENGAAFWIDAGGNWHLGTVRSQLTVTWPNGRIERLGLNEELRASRPALYTAADGLATPKVRRLLARELVLEYGGQGPWLPLRPGQIYTARIRTVSDTGGTPLNANQLVLCVPTNRLAKGPLPLPGMTLKISTQTEPDLAGVQMAIGGGPVFLKRGWRTTGPKPKKKNLPASVAHIWEKHPRSAIGWNRDYLYLVAVDGRQPGLSEGMTILELGTFMKDVLGCTDAMNLDGGGSTTLWYDGQVLNIPSDGEERPVANALFILPPAR